MGTERKQEEAGADRRRRRMGQKSNEVERMERSSDPQVRSDKCQHSYTLIHTLQSRQNHNLSAPPGTRPSRPSPNKTLINLLPRRSSSPSFFEACSFRADHEDTTSETTDWPPDRMEKALSFKRSDAFQLRGNHDPVLGRQRNSRTRTWFH